MSWPGIDPAIQRFSLPLPGWPPQGRPWPEGS